MASSQIAIARKAIPMIMGLPRPFRNRNRTDVCCIRVDNTQAVPQRRNPNPTQSPIGSPAVGTRRGPELATLNEIKKWRIATPTRIPQPGREAAAVSWVEVTASCLSDWFNEDSVLLTYSCGVARPG